MQLGDGRRALAFAEKEYNPSKGRVCTKSCEKALLVEVELMSDNDYRVNNSLELGLRETEEDSGVWRGCMVFLGREASCMEEQAMLHLLRIAAAIDADGEDWRLHGTAMGLAVAALSIDHTYLEIRGAEPPVRVRLPLWKGGLFSWGISDGNQDGSIKARYIDNTFDAAFDTEPESDNGKVQV